MKFSSNMWLIPLTLFVGMTSYAGELHITWGLEKPEALYFERLASAAENSAIRPTHKKTDKLYRFFGTTTEYGSVVESLMARHWNLWEQYKKTTKAPTREAYMKFASRKDPFFFGELYEVAPVLYFDFVGIGAKQYILTSIEVETLDFEEYRGGGFLDARAWYDIVLKHEKGKKSYSVSQKLRFNGSGRAELRFFSDNYIPHVGMAPMGCYMINITFRFLSDGKPVAVSTGPFKIDV